MMVSTESPLFRDMLSSIQSAVDMLDHLDAKYFDQDQFANDPEFQSLFKRFHGDIACVSDALRAAVDA